VVTRIPFTRTRPVGPIGQSRPEPLRLSLVGSSALFHAMRRERLEHAQRSPRSTDFPSLELRAPEAPA